MIDLDLSRDTPDELEGKRIVLGGREYAVGPRWRETSQGYAHWLRNAVSGQSLHVLQIRREYLERPQDAHDASHEKARLTSQLRAKTAEEGPVVAAMMRALDVCNGTVELHEWPMDGDQEQAALKPALEHAAASRWQDALQAIGEQLAIHPVNPKAHALRGTLYAEVGDFNAAHKALGEAIEIEPNFSDYQIRRLRAAVQSPSPIAALDLYGDFKRQFPLAHDADELAIHAFLRCGKSTQAHELLSTASIHKEARKALTPRVAAARSATAALQALSAQWDGRGGRPDNLLQRLRAASKAYPDNPCLNVNLAFALLSAGDAENAGQLLAPSIGCLDSRYTALCMANAGYCAVRSGQWRRAETYLSTAMLALVTAGGDPPDAFDAPGVGTWIDPDRGLVIEAPTPSAASILRPWMAESGAEPRPSALVRQLFALLERAEAAHASSTVGTPVIEIAPFAAEKPRAWWRSLFK